MLKRKKYLIGILVAALSINLVDTSMVLAVSKSESTAQVAPDYNGTGKVGKDKNNIKWSYNLCPDGTLAIWQYDDLSGNIEIPDKIDGYTVSRIKEYGLVGCTGITSVKIPKTVKSIGKFAFFGCTSLSNIDIPESVSEIGESTFENTPWLTNQRNLNPFVVVNNILIDGRSAAGDIIIPYNVVTVADGAFSYIDIDGQVKYRYFYGNSSSITSVMFPEGVKKIGKNAFGNCSNLTSIYIPSTVTEIGDYAFSAFRGDSVEIPSNVVNIGERAFGPSVKLIRVTRNVSDSSELTSGWNFRGNDRYYVNSSGKLQTGWMDLDGKRYYFYGNGQMAVGFINLGNDSLYYLDPTVGNNMGNLVTGWSKINGSWYYFNSNGKTDKEKGYMQTGWFYNNGSWYYFYGSGQMATGFINLGGDAYYYLDESNSSSVGIMRKGWQRINGNWYYFNRSSSEGIEGMMKKGWCKIDGAWYYFYHGDGIMAHDTRIDGYYVNSNGVWS